MEQDPSPHTFKAMLYMVGGQLEQEVAPGGDPEGDPTVLRQSGPTKAKEGKAAQTPEDSNTYNQEGDAKTLTLPAEHHGSTKNPTKEKGTRKASNADTNSEPEYPIRTDNT